MEGVGMKLSQWAAIIAVEYSDWIDDTKTGYCEQTFKEWFLVNTTKLLDGDDSWVARLTDAELEFILSTLTKLGS
jgi:hypothetical protein